MALKRSTYLSRPIRGSRSLPDRPDVVYQIAPPPDTSGRMEQSIISIYDNDPKPYDRNLDPDTEPNYNRYALHQQDPELVKAVAKARSEAAKAARGK